MLKLIINADDFGLNENVNEAILNSFTNGILRSVSLMANGNSFDQAVGIIKSNPELDVGVHLTLVEERPITDAVKLPTLVNENGKFHKHAIDFAKKYFSDKISLVEVRKELTAQFEKILDHGISISHIDSHQHVHILPKILEIIIELSNRYKIKFIRFPKEKFRHYMFHDIKSVERLVQMAVINIFCSKAKENYFYKTDYFAGFYFGGKLSKQNLLTLFSYLPSDGICELMCHPGLTQTLTNNSNSKYRKVEEMLALADNEVVDALFKKNIEITSYKNLVK